MSAQRGDFERRIAEDLRDTLRAHHPTMASETGPFSGCRCGQVKLGQDVIAHVVAHLQAAAIQRAAEELRKAADWIWEETPALATASAELHSRADVLVGSDQPAREWAT